MNGNFQDEMNIEYEMVPTKACMPMGMPSIMMLVIPRILKEIDNIEYINMKENNKSKKENVEFAKINKDNLSILTNMDICGIPCFTVNLMYKNIINFSLMNYFE